MLRRLQAKLIHGLVRTKADAGLCAGGLSAYSRFIHPGAPADHDN